MSSLLKIACRVQNRVQVRDEDGAAGVEYGILVALIAAIMIAAVKVTGTKVLKAFTDLNAVF